MHRREFLGAGAAAVALGATSKPTPLLSEFSYGAVQLHAGPAQKQFDENHRFLLNMSEDGMLRPFREREGLPTPGDEMGGWYATYAFAPGCHFGQWMSALSRCYAVTGDEQARAKASRLVKGYAATIEPAGKFYLNNRFPAYTYDKLVIGLIDAYSLTNDPIALETLSRATDAALPHLPGKAVPRQETPMLHGEDFTAHCWDESYTNPENLFLATQRTGDARYARMARQYLYDDGFFNELARNENMLPGKHAYSHVNALSSAAQAYLVTGNAKYLRAAQNGFAMVKAQSYATGGWGPDEHFFEPDSGGLFTSLAQERHSFETPCGAYAHFKITRYLLRITRDSRDGDSMERVMYNTVLGARPIQADGTTFYYSDYTNDARKGMHPDKWPCCSGTLPQIAADYHVSTYFRDARGLYVNLYLPSAVSGDLALRQTTQYPYESNVHIEVTKAPAGETSIFLRIPEWAAGARVSHSGRQGTRAVEPGTFAEIRRVWKAGDRVELELPLRKRLEAVDREHPDTVALLAGPLAMMPILSEQSAPVTRAGLLAGRVPVKAFMDITDERYRLYSRVTDG